MQINDLQILGDGPGRSIHLVDRGLLERSRSIREASTESPASVRQIAFGIASDKATIILRVADGAVPGIEANTGFAFPRIRRRSRKNEAADRRRKQTLDTSLQQVFPPWPSGRPISRP